MPYAKSLAPLHFAHFSNYRRMCRRWLKLVCRVGPFFLPPGPITYIFVTNGGSCKRPPCRGSFPAVSHWARIICCHQQNAYNCRILFFLPSSHFHVQGHSSAVCISVGANVAVLFIVDGFPITSRIYHHNPPNECTKTIIVEITVRWAC